MKVTALIMVFNEQRCIERCLQSLKNQVDHIIIIDTGSTDETLNIIKNYKNVDVYHSRWNDDFSEIRNLGTRLVSSEWFIWLDADEELIFEKSSLKQEIEKYKNIDYSKNIMISPIFIEPNLNKFRATPRVFRKKDNLYWEGKLHEYPETINGKETIIIESNCIIIFHDGYLPEILKSKQKHLRLEYIKENNFIKNSRKEIKAKYYYARDSIGVLSINESYQLLISFIQNTTPLFKKVFYASLEIKKILFNANCILLDLELLLAIRPNEIIIKELLNNIYYLHEKSSNYVYYVSIMQFLFNEEETENILNKLILFRKNLTTQMQMIHSEGFHLDYLIGCFYLRLKKNKQAKYFFKKIEGNYEDLSLRNLFENHKATI